MATSLKQLTRDWRAYADVNLYLGRCQHDTPADLVNRLWGLVSEQREYVSKVVDFGAGDGRFAIAGKFDRYIGYEIDNGRACKAALPTGACIVHGCAFASRISDADLCLGNPPFVRNQDLPRDWRKQAARIIKDRTDVDISGLANAWQYFAFLSLASTKNDGLVALIVPYEWVSRPSARALRDYVAKNRWNVAVYRLRDETFDHVLTTSSITLIDKGQAQARWRYFEETGKGSFRAIPSPSGGKHGVISYSRASLETVFARRGLSPGTQEFLTLTEQQRLDNNLHIRSDVVRCVTSLRRIPAVRVELTRAGFDREYRDAGVKCWLIRTDREPSPRLRAYLDSVPKKKRQTSTCLNRADWWRFTMPTIPSALVATGFQGSRPKAVANAVRARAVGSVSGVFGLHPTATRRFIKAVHAARLRARIVAHSNGLRKLEVGQLETFLAKKNPWHRARAARK